MHAPGYVDQGPAGPLAVLGQLVTQVGINRVKYPLWYDDQEHPEFVKELIVFSERLDTHGIELVGLLGDPPASLRDRFGRSTALRAAQLFTADPDAWYPSSRQTSDERSRLSDSSGDGGRVSL